MNHLNGFLIINKSKGFTSHDCVKRIKKLLNVKKVGHTGTLDPQVTGILPIALGNATRFIQYLPQEKTYLGIIKLGVTTDTDDIHGKVLATKEWPSISIEKLDHYLNNFRGKFQQVPPKLSSVHIKGVRAYKKFFNNEEFEIPAREVTINQLKILNWDQHNGKIGLKISCSAGTYIRSLARDLGQILDSEGCLYELSRIQSSGFDNKTCIDFNNIDELQTNFEKYLIPIDKALNHLPKYKLIKSEEILYWETGRKINVNIEKIEPLKNPHNNSPIKVMNRTNKLLGIGMINKEELSFIQPKLVLNAK